MMMHIFIGFITHMNHRNLVQLVPDEVKNMWNEWALRGLILISLSSQIILSLLGNIRKYNPRTRIRITLWCNYLLAYAVASAALGIITRTALDVCNTSHSISQHHKANSSELMSFWAPFLLHHLGGPDTITAFALEDNELLVKTLCRDWVSIRSSSVYTLVVLARLFSSPTAKPIGLFIRFHQVFRTCSSSKGFNAKVEAVPEPPLPVINHAYPQEGKEISIAYDLFQSFKRLFVDLILTFEDRDSSLSYFRHFKSSDAFRVVEIELGFAYDMLYTKANVVYTILGLILRLTSIFLLFLIPVGFYFLNDRNHYHWIDVAITSLLIGATIFMEIFAVITMLRSDWTDHWLSQRNYTRKSLVFQFLKQPTKQRWSGSIAQLDLLSVALEEKPASLMAIQKFFGVDKYRVKHRYKTYMKVSDDLQDLIYRPFHESMGGNSDPKVLCTHKGSFALRENKCDALLWSINKVEFDQSILIWHIATALCYYAEDEDKDHVGNIDIHRRESKNISDYLLYLLVSYPVMLPIGIGMIRYRDTCAEAMRFFKEKRSYFCHEI
ncbi:unnamed protein product [Lactuca virosa]|uniref:DUF4220 domain-containing protein n=1 Tax=Lactuca virosa TaxID=75947 RepID=A0AAU9N9D6_9ASTR|nr:unnamed protein product [Lactuca virosa]